MNIESFMKMVKIEFIESSGAYGHHPMQLAVKTEDDQLEINALLNMRIENIINRVKEYLSNNAKDIYVSLDLPATAEIENDFVIILNIKGDKTVTNSVLEYNPNDGEILNTTINDTRVTISTIISYFGVINAIEAVEVDKDELKKNFFNNEHITFVGNHEDSGIETVATKFVDKTSFLKCWNSKFDNQYDEDDMQVIYIYWSKHSRCYFINFKSDLESQDEHCVFVANHYGFEY